MPFRKVAPAAPAPRRRVQPGATPDVVRPVMTKTSIEEVEPGVMQCLSAINPYRHRGIVVQLRMFKDRRPMRFEAVREKDGVLLCSEPTNEMLDAALAARLGGQRG